MAESRFMTLAPVEPLPEAARQQVAVIGAGVVGLSCAIWLQHAGHSVTLIDREPPAPGVSYEHAGSFGNAATIAYSAVLPVAMPGVLARVPGMLLDRQGPLSIFWRDLPALAPWLWSFIRASSPARVNRIVGMLAHLLQYAEAGHAPLIAEAGFEDRVRRHGCLYLYRNEGQFRQDHEAFKLREQAGVRMTVLTRGQVAEREPELAPLYHKGVLFHDSCVLDDPHAYALGLMQAFQRRGGHPLRGEVSGLQAGADAVRVHVGDQTLDAQRVVVAAGAWSARLARMLGDRIRLDTERGYHVMFPDAGHLLTAPVCYPEAGFYLTPLGEGLRAAGTVELGGLGLPPRRERTDIIEKRAREYLPQLGDAGRKWLGFRPSMPDSLPVIGVSPRDARVVYAFGHGHVGLTLGGITGRLVSDIISARPAPFDLSPLRPGRY